MVYNLTNVISGLNLCRYDICMYRYVESQCRHPDLILDHAILALPGFDITVVNFIKFFGLAPTYRIRQLKLCPDTTQKTIALPAYVELFFIY